MSDKKIHGMFIATAECYVVTPYNGNSSSLCVLVYSSFHKKSNLVGFDIFLNCYFSMVYYYLL